MALYVRHKPLQLAFADQELTHFVVGISIAVCVPFVLIAFNVEPMVSLGRNLVNERLMRALWFIIRLLKKPLSKMRVKKLTKKWERLEKQLEDRNLEYTTRVYDQPEDSGSISDMTSVTHTGSMSDRSRSTYCTSLSRSDFSGEESSRQSRAEQAELRLRKIQQVPDEEDQLYI
jgi:hypothetical protein